MVDRTRGPILPLCLLFLAAACQTKDDSGSAEELEAKAQADCDVLLACFTDLPTEECPGATSPECITWNSEDLHQCIEALNQRLEDIDAGDYTCNDEDYPTDLEECRGLFTVRNDNDCGASIGRPLFDEGTQVLPSVVRMKTIAADDRGRAAEAWLMSARAEYASVAAFNRLSMELMSLGAPASIVEATQQAALDEVRHTHMCLEIANRLAKPLDKRLGSGAHEGDAFAMGTLPLVLPRPSITLEQLAVEALLEGCVGEGAAAAWASLAAHDAPQHYATPLGQIATEELTHAALSWRVVGWALRSEPSLASTLWAALDKWEREHGRGHVNTEHDGLAEYGVLGHGREQDVSRALVRTVVRPTLRGVFERTSSPFEPAPLAV